MNPTWFQVARRPKWLLSLLLALAIAASFALLGQWQLSRSFPPPVTDPSLSEQVDLLEIETPAEPLRAGSVNRLVRADVFLDLSNVYVIANRFQLRSGERIPGYWIVANSQVLFKDSEESASLTLALGFAEYLETARGAREKLMNSVQPQAFLPIQGRYLPSEAPLPADGESAIVLESLSLAQLINLYSAEPLSSFAGFVVVDSEPGFGLERIELEIAEQAPVNWLTLFYAVEWALFAGFALFLWWRLVEDQRLRETKISKR